MDQLQKVTSLCKRRGFVFPSSEIYGGWEATYDFGPLGVEVLNRIRNLWWREFVYKHENVVGLDGALISHPKVWEASGHTELFADVMVEDTITNKRYRADHISDLVEDGMKPEEIDEVIKTNNIKSPEGNPLSKSKYFNQLVEVQVGTTQDTKSKAYLRGETCQPIFYNYQLVKDSMRKKIPFGIAQIGKAFRNEIKVGPFFFRMREFEQMELEMFVNPKDHEKFFEDIKKRSMDWLVSLGIDKDKLQYREQTPKEKAHYNKIAHDLEYKFEDGWKEIQGIHYRTDWDLKRHGEFSGTDFTYNDEKTQESYIPHVVEYSIGLSRLLYVLLMDSYKEEENRVVLKIDPRLAPYDCAVFPLVSNKEEIINKAREVYKKLVDANLHVAWDDRGNIGKRYYAQDEIGTLKCITIDYDTLKDDTVTVRDRDTMKQERVKIDELKMKI